MGLRLCTEMANVTELMVALETAPCIYDLYVTFPPLSTRHQATVRDMPDHTFFTSLLLEQMPHSYTHLYT